MSVKSKIFFLFLGTFLFSLAGFFITWQYQRHELASVQEASLNEIKNSFDEIVKVPTKELKDFVYENSYWDEMVSFVATQNMKWAEEILTGSVRERQYDYVAIYDTKKNTIFYHQRDEEAGWIKNLLPRSTLKMKEPFFSHYFLMNDGKLIEIYSAPIQPSKDIKRQSTPQGYFLAGKIWDQPLVDHFAKHANLHIEIVPKGDTVLDRYAFVYPLKSYDETIIGYLGIKPSSTKLGILSQIYTTQFYMLLVFGLITIGFASLMIYFMVVKPLKMLSKMIVTRDASILEGCKLKKDEFSDLAHSLETLFNYQKTLEDEKANIELQLHQRCALDETLELSEQQQDQVLGIKELYEVIGSQKLADKFLRKFLDELIGKYAVLPAQIANHEEIGAVNLHTLKGTSANVRAYRLHRACRVIDEKHKSGSHILSGEIDALREAINEVKERLTSLGYSATEAGGLSVKELHQLYDEIKDTLSYLNTQLPEKQRILIANLQEVVDPDALEEWDWAMCENEYEKALELMIKWKIFKEKA